MPDGQVDMEKRLAALEQELQVLRDEAAIRNVLSRYGRAIDRMDAELLASLFYPDADIHYGPDVFEGIAADFVPHVMKFSATMRLTHHMLGNIMIDLRGDVALVETYSIATHIIERDNGVMEFTSGSRYLDRFERRGDEWRIASRQVVVDWLRELTANDSLFEVLRGPPRGAQGSQDLSCRFFGF